MAFQAHTLHTHIHTHTLVDEKLSKLISCDVFLIVGVWHRTRVFMLSLSVPLTLPARILREKFSRSVVLSLNLPGAPGTLA